jgi:hypothetical protein
LCGEIKTFRFEYDGSPVEGVEESERFPAPLRDYATDLQWNVGLVVLVVAYFAKCTKLKVFKSKLTFFTTRMFNCPSYVFITLRNNKIQIIEHRYLRFGKY